METPKLKEFDFKGTTALGFINFGRVLRLAFNPNAFPRDLMTYAEYKEIQEAKKLAPKKVRKPLQQQWEEVDFLLLTKLTLGDIWRELRCSLRGEPMPPRTTQEEYLELLNAKRNTQK